MKAGKLKGDNYDVFLANVLAIQVDIFIVIVIGELCTHELL